MAAERSGSKSPKRTTSALESLAEQLSEVQESELIHINIDVVASVATALGILPKLEKLKDSIAKLPGLDSELLDGFETYAMALYEAHAVYLAASQPTESLQVLVEQGTKMRDRLYADVQALVARELVSAQEIREVKTSNGYKALAMDLTLLTDAVQRRWSELKGKTAITLEEVMQAETAATQLLRAIGEKEQAPAVIAEASAQRARAFALFMRAYDEVRRAVTYLRWEEGDADTIAPSLYQARATGRRKPEPTPTPGATPPAVTPPVVPAPLTPSTSQGTSAGFPDSDPFTPN